MLIIGFRNQASRARCSATALERKNNYFNQLTFYVLVDVFFAYNNTLEVFVY